MQFLNEIISGNRILDYLVALFLFMLCIFVLKILKHIVFVRLKKWSEKTKTTIDDFIINVGESVAFPFLYYGVFYVSISTLNLESWMQKGINIVGLALLSFFVARLIIHFMNYSVDRYLLRVEGGITLKKSMDGMLTIAKFVVWALAVIMLLDNLGYKISTVVAGLGIGGVAIALAAQAVLGDLFSYFAIIFDRPFEVGDFIIVDDYLGVVDRIGVKTTRITSLGGEQLIFSNSNLTSSRIRNYKRMAQRRVLFRLGVVYGTTLEQVKAIPGIIKDIVTKIEDTKFDRAHFFSFADFSLVFEVVYYVNGADYNKYMDIQEKINVQIKQEFEKRGIEFAFPTQTVHLQKTN